MKDVKTEIEHDGIVYSIVFNLNVMQNIQQEYGSVSLWGDLTDGTFTGKSEYEKKNGEGSWDDLDDEEKQANRGEPDAKAIIFGFTEMINEGIDMENEHAVALGEKAKPFMSVRQVGRLITSMGLEFASQKMQETVIESQKVEGIDSKNE